MVDEIVLEEKSSEAPPPPADAPPPSKIGRVPPPPKMSRRAQAARKRRLEQRLKRAIRSKGKEFYRWRSVIVTLGDRRFIAWKAIPSFLKERDREGEKIRLGTILPYWGIQHLAYGMGKEGSRASAASRATAIVARCRSASSWGWAVLFNSLKAFSVISACSFAS